MGYQSNPAGVFETAELRTTVERFLETAGRNIRLG